jgi:hypothetical protein
MRSLKMFGLAALMALMAMAFVGASSAMAEETALCKADEEPCQESNWVSSIHEEGKASILFNGISDECNVLFSGTAEPFAEMAEVVKGNFTYSGCTNSCTMTEENGPAELEALKAGHEEDIITYKYLLHVNCLGSVNCRFTGAGLKGLGLDALLTGGTGMVSIIGQEMTKESGSLCPTKVVLDITTKPLSAIYIQKPEMKCVARANGLYSTQSSSTTCTGALAGLTGSFELSPRLLNTP